jgi:ABC-type transport system substrate-binding protein
VGPDTGNQGSLADPEVDRLIDALQVETDRARRLELLHRLHREVHALQVYSYGVFVPRKFAASRRLRGLQTFSIEPGYSIRRWYLED